MLKKYSSLIISICGIGIMLGSFAVIAAVFYFARDLPNHQQLQNYEPPTVTRLYAADGQMLTEYAKEKRLYVPITLIPQHVIDAFVAAEDKTFYSHHGIDYVGIIRAALQNVMNIGSDRSLVGGSTITQQVVKNFLLTNEKSFERKIKEAILAYRMSHSFSKERVLELYLNEIYLGNRSYGVASAALNYFNKSIDELSTEDAAMLAALPKAPSKLDPRRFPEKAKTRRDWVIKRMREEGYINKEEEHRAVEAPIALKDRDQIRMRNAGFFTDAVKQELIQLYGVDETVSAGYVVRTTMEPELQIAAEQALNKGLLAYDKRHGYRGPYARIQHAENWQEELPLVKKHTPLGEFELAVVLEAREKEAIIGLTNATQASITLESMKWARSYINENALGAAITSTRNVVTKGDVILVSKQAEGYHLEQIPQVNGAIVSLDPHTGRVLAMVGGYTYHGSQFNRAMQAKRQPGSALKPFIYLSALENNFAPNAKIVDEAIQLDQGVGEKIWQPQNHSGKYYGATTLRMGVEKSRNAMTVRLAHLLGISKPVEITKRFGIYQKPPRNFSLVLGSVETDLLSLTQAYASLVSGGKKVISALIERIQDRDGKTIYRRDDKICEHCVLKEKQPQDAAHVPLMQDVRTQLTDPISAYQIVSILEGVVKRGTGIKARSLGKTLAGKTGTTNDSIDAWFMGFSADIVTGVYVGFDQPKTLGKHEYGSSAALPIWIDFMKEALKDKQDVPFRRPAGIKMVKINRKTGELPTPSAANSDIIFEAFRSGTEPGAISASIAEEVKPVEELIEGVY